MGRIYRIKRFFRFRDHFSHTDNCFYIPIEIVTESMKKVDLDWGVRLPKWAEGVQFINGVTIVNKKFIAKDEWFTVAIDFDGVIIPYPTDLVFPEIPAPNMEIIKIINKLFLSGFSIIIWTVRGGRLIKPLRKFLHNNGILFHYINESPEYDNRFKNLSRKIAANVYWDDRNIGHVSDPEKAYKLIIEAYENAIPVDPSKCDNGIDSKLRR